MTAILTLTALFAALAAPPDEEVRLAAVKRWRDQYERTAANLDRLIAELEAAGNRAAALKKVKDERAALKKDPFTHRAFGTLAGQVKPGVAGMVPGQPAKVVKKDGDAWVVEVRHQYTKFGSGSPSWEILTLRLTDLPETIKPRVGGTVRLPGLWLVTASESVAAKPVLTVTPLVVQPEEMPEECRPKAKK